jgi:hypothetical protein
MVNWNIINRTTRKNIVTFITRHHPCVVVAHIEQENEIYKINLLNGESLVFHTDGSYIKNIF